MREDIDWDQLKNQYLQQLHRIREEFERISNDREQAIHEFLESTNFLFDIFANNRAIHSKYRLADSFVPDFVLVGNTRWSNAIRPTVIFVEIERANLNLFTQKGEPTSALTHAIFQLQQWKNWLQTNRDHFRSRLMQRLQADFGQMDIGLGHGFSEQFGLVIGRRDSMSTQARLHLQQMNEDLQDIRILTYDTLFADLIDREENTVASSGWHTTDIRRSDTVPCFRTAR